MVKKAQRHALESMTIDVACVIHGDAYSWDYVENLYRAVKANMTPQIRFHVYTEPHREVPNHMIKHELEHWPEAAGPRRAWWYKMNLFNTDLFAGRILYFDLDTVVTGNLDWIIQDHTDPDVFYGLRDFTYLFKPRLLTINSSVLWFDNQTWRHVWDDFRKEQLSTMIKKHRGDQDFITHSVRSGKMQFLNTARVASYRWQALDGGFEFKRRVYHSPGTGISLDPAVSLLIFHGNPKPKDVNDPVIRKHWHNDK